MIDLPCRKNEAVTTVTLPAETSLSVHVVSADGSAPAEEHIYAIFFAALYAARRGRWAAVDSLFEEAVVPARAGNITAAAVAVAIDDMRRCCWPQP